MFSIPLDKKRSLISFLPFALSSFFSLLWLSLFLLVVPVLPCPTTVFSVLVLLFLLVSLSSSFWGPLALLFWFHHCVRSKRRELESKPWHWLLPWPAWLGFSSKLVGKFLGLVFRDIVSLFLHWLLLDYGWHLVALYLLFSRSEYLGLRFPWIISIPSLSPPSLLSCPDE